MAHLKGVDHQGSTVATLRQNCEDLGTVHHTDTDGTELYAETCDCRTLVKTPRQRSDLSTGAAFAYDKNVFPNRRVALHTLVTIAVSIAGCECFFNKLTLIFTYLRASMRQDHLGDLALLSIERETVE